MAASRRIDHKIFRARAGSAGGADCIERENGVDTWMHRARAYLCVLTAVSCHAAVFRNPYTPAIISMGMWNS